MKAINYRKEEYMIAATTTRMQYHVLTTIPLTVVLLLIFLLCGCKPKAPQAKTVKPAVTLANLQTAYGKEVAYQKMYVLFAARAEKDHFKNVANLYRALSRSKGIHVANHAKLLRNQGIEPAVSPHDSTTVGTTLQTLKMALSIEEIEYGSMYPNLARSADAEQFAEARDQFKCMQDADARHGELIREAIGRNGNIPQVLYLVCPECGYIVTSAQTEECPACHTKKDKFEKI